jgi:hypothetical protein
MTPLQKGCDKAYSTIQKKQQKATGKRLLFVA